MKRLILKIQKLRNKYGFNSVSDLHHNCKPITFIDSDGCENIVVAFGDDSVEVETTGDDGYECFDIDYIETSCDTLEQILQAFDDTILENDKFESVQYYSNI